MKFGPVHPRPNTDPHPYDLSVCDQLISFAQLHNMGVRGHALVWHNQNPDWLTHGDFTPKQLSAILQDHITTVRKHLGANIYAYDVVNEALDDDGKMHSTPWYDKPGVGLAGQGTKYIEQALRWVHAASPSA
jgi:endo-1,4-beta-xylanase